MCRPDVQCRRERSRAQVREPEDSLLNGLYIRPCSALQDSQIPVRSYQRAPHRGPNRGHMRSPHSPAPRPRIKLTRAIVGEGPSTGIVTDDVPPASSLCEDTTMREYEESTRRAIECGVTGVIRPVDPARPELRSANHL